MKKGALTGLLLFGMFFGAGNLIFPPALGILSGEHFWPAILGFVVSGVGIAVIALIVGTLNPKGYVHEISRKISPLFATFYLVALYLAIGPFFAIPRTATTSFEVGIAPLLGDANLGLWLFGFTA
ncbi:branched-chain amino acid transport system II carrier protein, partial [Streptococcus parasuis]